MDGYDEGQFPLLVYLNKILFLLVGIRDGKLPFEDPAGISQI